jgi:hypothetical protein
MGEGSAATAAVGVRGFPAALTSFVGRAAEEAEVAGLLAEYRLVTVTGPGGWARPGSLARLPGGWRAGSPTVCGW